MGSRVSGSSNEPLPLGRALPLPPRIKPAYIYEESGALQT